jgi:glutamate-1-semialdehyde 2,1-aminomutase
MSCLRLARGFTGRDKVVKFEGCYHGHVDSLLVRAGSGALTLGQPDSAGVPRDLAALTVTLPFNDAAAVEEYFAREKDSTAAVIVEPLPANAGLIPPLPGYLQKLRDLCTAHGTLLVFDEVMTGFRVARGGMQELTGIQSDLTAMGKVIGGGLPVGAFGGRAEIMDHLAPDGPVYQAGTLSGNPLAMAAGLAQLRELERCNAWDRLEELGARLETGLRGAAEQSGCSFHRAGSMFGLFFTAGPVRNLEDARKSDTAKFAKFFHYCLEHGVYFPPSQFETGFISTAHTDEDIARTVAVVVQALRHAA